MADTTRQQVRIARTIPGPREEVFRAWVEPELFKQWFGPGEFTIPLADLDVRPGGEYLVEMKPAEGDSMKLTGTYREIDPPNRLVFTWSWALMWAEAPDSLVTVEFSDVPGGTEVVVTHGDFDSDDEGAPYRSGWEGGLDKLLKLFPSA
jgi:uncharacterized protein YndB with AHSA1/START domain